MLVYIAGPISAPTQLERESNIRIAEAAYARLISEGLAAVCVHSTARLLWGTLDEEAILHSDVKILERCDAVLVVGDWRKSAGTRMEIKAAAVNEIPVYYDIDALLEVHHARCQNVD